MVVRVPPVSRFARFQALHDLRAVLAAGGTAACAVIAARVPGLPPSGELEAVALGTGRMDARSVAFHPALALAASLPQDDRQGFLLATALLLADRMQDGAGEDDLYWHYDAHVQTYARQAPDVRSAILMAFFLLHERGRVTLDTPPPPELRAARPGGLVRAALTAAPADAARAFKQALAGGTTAPTEAMWRAQARAYCAIPPLAGAARHLYATRPGWDPYRDWSDDLIATKGIAIPFPCALPLPHGKPG